MLRQILIGGALTFLVACEARAGTIYVKAGATGADDGTSWTDAYTDLQDGLGEANSGDQVWVAGADGTPLEYMPGSDRADSFQLESGVEVYGGFDGASNDFDERNPGTYITVLSGDIEGDNIHHIVTGTGTASTAVLDGFTITRGRAQGATIPNGAGLLVLGNDVDGPTVRNCLFYLRARSKITWSFSPPWRYHVVPLSVKWMGCQA